MNVTGRGTPAYPSTTASTAASTDTPAASRAPVLELDHVTLELGAARSCAIRASS